MNPFSNFHAPSFGLGAIAGSAITVGVGYFFWPDQKKTKDIIADLASENKRIVNDANSLIRKIESEAAVSAQETKLRELKLQELDICLTKKQKDNEAAEKLLADEAKKIADAEKRLSEHQKNILEIENRILGKSN